MSAVANHKSCGALLELDDVKRALGLVEQSAALRISPIPVAHIVGTVGRCGDFDRCFHLLRPELRNRMHRVREAFPDGDFPPIQVSQIDEAYFVSDGHHRVAVARQLGVEYIDAVVTQIHGPYGLGSDATLARIELTGRERLFLKESGLASARPTVGISSSSSDGYGELLETVKAHGYDLIQQEGMLLSPNQVAAHWYECVFRPTLKTAEANGLSDLLSSCHDGDIFLCVHRGHRRAFGTECAAAEDAIQQTAKATQESLTSRKSQLFHRLLPSRRRSPPTPPLQRRL